MYNYYFEGSHLSLDPTDPHDSRLIKALGDFAAGAGEDMHRLRLHIYRLISGAK